MASTIRRRLLVAGRVQGVGYRAACARVAAALPVTGSVRNLTDGRVEVVAAGPGEAVERLTDWCRVGPRSARVETVEISDEPLADPPDQPDPPDPNPPPAPGFRVL